VRTQNYEKMYLTHKKHKRQDDDNDGSTVNNTRSRCNIDSIFNRRNGERGLEAHDLTYHPSKSTLATTSSILKVSLWLIPPEEGEASSLLQREIESVAKLHGTPTVPPHVTIVGGIEVNAQDVAKIVDALQKELVGFGPVPCNFDREQGILGGYIDNEKKVCQWNQSTVAILKREAKLIRLIRTSRKILRGDNVESDTVDTQLFVAPTYEPHLSLAYSDQYLGDFVFHEELPPDFEAFELALWSTEPSTLEGVEKWREIARVSLL